MLTAWHSDAERDKDIVAVVHICGHGVCCGQMVDWLEGEFLDEQVKSIKEISEYITNLKRVGPGLGEYMFDKETLDE